MSQFYSTKSAIFSKVHFIACLFFEGYWEGKCYVFDGRILQPFSEDAEVISQCRECGTVTDRFSHCSNEPCGAQMIICEECENKNLEHYCVACAPKFLTTTG